MPRARSAATQLRTDRWKRVLGAAGPLLTGAQVTRVPVLGRAEVPGSAPKGRRTPEPYKRSRLRFSPARSPAVPGGPGGGEKCGSGGVVPEPGQGNPSGTPRRLLGPSARLRPPLPPHLRNESLGGLRGATRAARRARV